MIYRDEFTRLKQIYDRMPEARRLMIGPMAGLPFMAMALYGIVLLPFGYGGFGMTLLIGALGEVLAAAMIFATMDIRPEIAAWRNGEPATREAPGLPPEAALRLLSIANDPGKPGREEAAEEAAPEPLQWSSL